jgi:beta-fructofuranosidase
VPDLTKWQKDPNNPIISAPPKEIRTTIFRDHSIFRHDDHWYQVIGSGVEKEGGNCILYRSRDLIDWEFVDVLVEGPNPITAHEEVTGWECPDMFASNGEYALIVSHWDERPLSVDTYVGEFDGTHFSPRTHELLDAGMSFYAPQSFTDERGRRIQFGWMRESRSVDAHIRDGWAGAMSLPRELWIEPDHTLGCKPVEEVYSLIQSTERISLSDDGQPVTLQSTESFGKSCLIDIRLRENPSHAVGIAVLSSSSGSETTIIRVDPTAQSVSLDTTHSSSSPDAIGSLAVCEGIVPRKLQIFVDVSIVEVFMDDRKSITGRAYPEGTDSHGIRLQGVDLIEANVSTMATKA